MLNPIDPERSRALVDPGNDPNLCFVAFPTENRTFSRKRSNAELATPALKNSWALGSA